MAINSTSGGSATVQITSWAYNEASAGSQAQANGIDEVVFANDIATVNNGNLMASPTFTGRFLVKNRGLGDEEVRYINAQTAGTGSTIIATVSEPWDDAPASADTLEVCYIVQDTATVNGVALVNKTNDDYDFSKFFEVQSGAGFGLLNGATMISDTNGSTTTAEFTCLSGGWFQVGVKQFGTGVRGGRITLSAGTGPIDGDWGIDIQAGGIGNFYSVDIKGGVSYNTQFNGTCEIQDSKLFKCIYNGDFTGVITMTNTVIEGTDLTTDQLTCDASTDVQSLVFGQADGFTDDASATVETITLQDVDWSGLNQYIQVQNANKTYVVLDAFNFDPVTGTQEDLLFTAAGLVEQRNSILGTTRKPNATAVSGTKVYIQEHDQTDTIVFEGVTDATGHFSDDVLYRTFQSGTTDVTVTTYGSWGTKAYKYGKQPFDAIIDYSNRNLEQEFTVIDDLDITALSREDALFSGSGIEVIFHGTGSMGTGSDPRPMKVIRIDGVTTAPTYGDTIEDNATSTKSGSVIDFVARGGGTYDVVLEYWTGVEFADNDVLDLNGASWDGGAVQADTAGFYSEVHWWMGESGSNNTSDVIYDYQIAQLSTTASIGSEWEQVVIAGDVEWSVPMIGNQLKTFRTRRNALTHQEGWWLGRVSDLGNIEYYTMDDGTQWTPPATVTHTTSGVVSGTIVRYVSGSAGSEEIIYAATASVSQEVSYTYTWEADRDVTVLILSLEYENQSRDITLTNADAELNIQQGIDRSYNNPP